jgi:predicted RNA-binding Zn ribbon-like protein
MITPPFISLDFMNSLYRDYRGTGNDQDRLRSAEWMTDFLRRWKLANLQPPPNSVVSQLVRFRNALWRIGEAVIRKQKPRSSDITLLNEVLSAAPLRRQLVEMGGKYKLATAPARKDWVWVRSEIAADFAALLSEEKLWRRVKLCANPDCRWIFYDATKSKTRSWCAPVCGNLIKVRRFRERRRRASSRKR